MRLAVLAAALLAVTEANAQTRLQRADVAAADTVKIRIDLDLCPNFWCMVKQAVITRDGQVRRTARIREVIVAIDTLRVSVAQIDSMTRAIAATGFDTLQVPECTTVETDVGQVTVTVARGPTRRSFRMAENCPPRDRLLRPIRAAIDRVASLSSWNPDTSSRTSLPAHVGLAGCYRLSHGEWQGPTTDRFEPPTRIQLGLEPGLRFGRPAPGWFAMSPALPSQRSGSAVWRPAERGFELWWGDGFTGMTGTLVMQIDSYDGTGKVFTDMVGVETPSLRLSAARIACAE